MHRPLEGHHLLRGLLPSRASGSSNLRLNSSNGPASNLSGFLPSVDLTGAEHPMNDDRQLPSDGHDCLLAPHACGKSNVELSADRIFPDRRPCRLDQQGPDVPIALSCDATSADALPAAVLSRSQAKVGSQVVRRGESLDVSQFREKDATAPGTDTGDRFEEDSLGLLLSRGKDPLDVCLHGLDSIGESLDRFDDVVESQPMFVSHHETLQSSSCSGTPTPCWIREIQEEEFRLHHVEQSCALAHQLASRSHQISNRPLLDTRHRDALQDSTRQFGGETTTVHRVRLDALTGSSWDQARGHNDGGVTQSRQLIVEPKSRRSRLVDDLGQSRRGTVPVEDSDEDVDRRFLSVAEEEFTVVDAADSPALLVDVDSDVESFCHVATSLVGRGRSTRTHPTQAPVATWIHANVRCAVPPRGAGQAHTTILALPLVVLLISGCGLATVCPKGPTDTVSAECLQTSLTPGDRLQVHAQADKPTEGRYLHPRDINGTPTLVLLRGTGSLYESTDTLQIKLSDIKKVARHRQASPFVAGFIVGGIVATGVMLLVTVMTWGGVE